MIKSLFQKLLNKSGKNYKIDAEIPSSLLIRNLRIRFIMLARGYIYLQKKVFLGRNCSILHKKNIVFGKNCTFEEKVYIDNVSWMSNLCMCCSKYRKKSSFPIVF